MLNSAILEVIIGVIFVYSLLSILVTQINSIISTALKLRARHLRDALDDLVTDPTLRAKVFTHPLIRLVSGQPILPTQRIEEEQARAVANAPVNDVNWINPVTFADVVISTIKVTADQELFSALLNIIDGMPSSPERRQLRLVINRIMTQGQGLDELRTLIAQLKEPIYRDALTDALDKVDEEIGRMGLDPSSVIAITAGLRNIKNPYFRAAMETILSGARSMEDAKNQLIEWFNSGMDRASNTFTRTMSMLSLLVGLLLALLLNVDTIHLAQTLWNDPALRTIVAEAAANSNLTLPEPGEADSGSTDATPEELELAISEAQATLDQLFSLRLPLGWYYENLSHLDPDQEVNVARFRDARNLWNYLAVGANPYWSTVLLIKLAGILATMIAIAQGAPFWFNVLNRIATGGRKSDD